MARRVDPIELAIFKSAFHSIAEEMGATLRRTAFSPNIKERRDYSCAVFDADGQVIAMGDHMPVHLGSMPMSVRAAVQALRFDPDDVAILNDPYAGGTHLPDITMVLPVFIGESKHPVFYVSSRAHHADVGGTYPGSMGLCSEIYQEGIRIPPVKIVRAGRIDRNVMDLLLYNVRTAAEREGDLTSQIGACRVGAQRLQEMTSKYGLKRVRDNMRELLDYSERLMKAELSRLPAGEFAAEDFMDDDGVSDKPIRVAVTLRIDPAHRRAVVDFSGTGAQVAGSINAVYAITYSAVFYVFRCLLSHPNAPNPGAPGAPDFGDDVPATAGLMRPIELRAPEGSIVNARPPAAVAGGNVETSQRMVDVLMRALAEAAPERVPAASSGTMTNVTIGGIDPRSGKPFAYYETTAGGMGARPGLDGLSGVHTHMTNSLNTPVEALEYAYPFRVRRYGYRHGSGGRGKNNGGDGLVREIELLTDSQVTILADRRKFAPYGLSGGGTGATGHTKLLHRDGSSEELPGKCNRHAHAGDIVRIETPGGGGWG